eukprot:CAMPEP_0170487472 /NCGR_PEP_ID=MMETSP0208-20121228/6278_1 /TAXON_ID=197538 /ORGANISM="Strombidium inclinatum, Strain S3" /LENGTH=56 /DNA_ID=CAMNT_0010761763 /DNA_START=406 /DNA_END=576 /DNA_ORIENTATION=+
MRKDKKQGSIGDTDQEGESSQLNITPEKPVAATSPPLTADNATADLSGNLMGLNLE